MTTRHIDRVFKHPNYIYHNSIEKIQKDVALIRLKLKLAFGYFVQKINLLTNNFLQQGKFVSVLGWRERPSEVINLFYE